MELSDEQWKVLEPLLPEYPSGKPGRPWRSHREVLDAITLGVANRGTLAGFTRKVSTLSNVSSAFQAMVYGRNI